MKVKENKTTTYWEHILGTDSEEEVTKEVLISQTIRSEKRVKISGAF